MRASLIIFVLAVSGATFVATLLIIGRGPVPLCSPHEACVREWIAATSGWAAALVALPTILYLSKQVRDADRHQRTGFAIQLRKQRILAARTARIANVALDEMTKQEEAQAGQDLRSWDRETVEGIIHHLRDGTISAFESEIAHPASIGGWGMALIVERGYSGIEPALQSAPEIARRYFENIREQAQEFLKEVADISGITK